MVIFLPILSVVAILAGGFAWQNNSYLLRYGKKAHGIVFKNNVKRGINYPVVRFLTDDQTWITQELKTGYSIAKKEGAKIEIIYDPDDPTQVEINSAFNLQVLPVFFIIIGAILLSVSVFRLLALVE